MARCASTIAKTSNCKEAIFASNDLQLFHPLSTLVAAGPLGRVRVSRA